MYLDFVERMENTLLGQGFHHITGGEPALAMFARQNGAVRYVFALWDADMLGAEALAAREAEVKSALEAAREENGARSVILFNAVCAANGAEWAARLDTQEPFYGQPMFTVEYLVCFGEEQLRFHPDAPASMQNADVWLSGALHGGNGAPVPVRVSMARTPAVKQEWLVYVILVLNAIVLTVMEMQGGSTELAVLRWFGALERDLIVTAGEWWRLVTAMFIHIGVSHFLYNSLSLYIFGMRLERHFGRARFMMIYILTGIIGNIGQVIFSDATAAGASGAIYGLMGAALALTQRTRKSVDGLNFMIMIIFIAVGIAQGLATPGIGNAAHICGMLSGYVFGLILSGDTGKREIEAQA